MDQQTLELLRTLQSNERDAATFDRVRGLLASQRSLLVAGDDRATLADLSELLEVWAETAPPELAAEATAEAAHIAEDDLEQAERAVQLYVLSLERGPTSPGPLARLDALLCRRGERERLESILAMHAKSLLALPEVDPEVGARVLCRLGELRAERGTDLNGAIAAYEQALDLAADAETIRALAQLYAKRGGLGDAAQAAELFATLGDVLGPEQGAAMLERALDLHGVHDAALDLLESYVPPAEQNARLKARWTAYIEESENESGVDKRRLLLARAHAADAEYRDALICLGPLIDKSAPEALSLQAAFLANLHENEPPKQSEQNGSGLGASGGKRRPSTLVGFRLPTGEGVPDVAEPLPEGGAAHAADDGATGEDAGGAMDIAASAKNPLAARSGETLVGFRVPQALANTLNAANAAEASAAQAAAGKNQSHAEERVSEVVPRPSAAAAQPSPTSDAPRAASTTQPGDVAAPSRASAQHAVARATGPAALSAALSSSARASGVGSAQRPSTPPRQSATAAPAQRAASNGTQSAADKAAALRASRNSAPPQRASSGPPPLRSSRAGGAAAASNAARAAHLGSPATFATTLPMPSAVPMPAALAATVPFAATPAAAFAPPGAVLGVQPERAQSVPAPVAAVLPLGEAQPTSAALDDLRAGSKRKLDPRWLVVGGLTAVAVIAGALWSSGGSAPASVPASAAAAPRASAAVPAAAAPAAQAALPALPATTATTPGAQAAAVAAPGAAGDALTAAVVATPEAAAAATPSKSAPKANPGEVKLGQVRVRGGQLSVKAVTAALDERLDSFEGCYSEAIEDKPRLEGKLTFSFNVDKSGKASRVRKLNGTMKHTPLLRCSTEAIEKTRFPKAKKKTAQITLPVTYSQ